MDLVAPSHTQYKPSIPTLRSYCIYVVDVAGDVVDGSELALGRYEALAWPDQPDRLGRILVTVVDLLQTNHQDIVRIYFNNNHLLVATIIQRIVSLYSL